MPEEVFKNIKKISGEAVINIKKILKDQKVGEIIREGFKIAILGPPNVGKSTLLNQLSKRNVAIVSEIAGTTRDAIETHFNIDGYPVVVSDTAGIRESADEIEQKGIKLALEKAADADLKLVVLELKNVNFKGILANLMEKNSILVINKSDLLEVKLSPEITKFNHVLISAKNNHNLDSLITKIKNELKINLLKAKIL